MKILHVIESLRKNAGGAAEIVPIMAEEQHLCGHDVTMVTLGSADYSDTALHAKNAGVKLAIYPRSKILPGVLGFSLPYVRELDKFIADADVVHVAPVPFPLVAAPVPAECARYPEAAPCPDRHICGRSGRFGRQRP